MNQAHGVSDSRQLKPYLEYKDSGLAWLGEIPAHWRTLPLGRIGRFSASGIDKKTVEGEENVLMVNYTDVYANTTKTLDKLRNYMQTTCPKWKVKEHSLAKGDILFTPSSETEAEVGFSAVVIEDLVKVVYSYHLIRLRPDSNIGLDLGFSKFLCNNTGVLSQFTAACKGTTRQILTREDFRDTIVSLPPIEEQRDIAAFLDGETAKIDALIERMERLIELLQEKRSALITQAITKGLEPNVPMKDSGIEWLGKIPAHWDLLSLKRCVLLKAGSIKTGPFGSQLLAANMQGEDVKVYNQRTVIDRDFLKGDVFISREKFQELKAFEIYPGDVLVTTRGTIGRCAIVPADSDQGILHPCLMRIQPDPAQLLREYIALLIQESNLVRTQLAIASNATTIDVIYSDTMRQILIPKPPISEQAAIIKWINELMAEIHRLNEMVLEAIDRLKEYRTALISAAVTGKIDLRESIL